MSWRNDLARDAALAILCLGMLLGTGLSGSGSASGAESEWGPVEEVPPTGSDHVFPVTAVFPDGTLVAAWTHEEPDGDNKRLTILRSTRPPAGAWSEPVALPVDEVRSVNGLATRPDGSVLISYSLRFGLEFPHEVRIWNVDGTVGDVALVNGTDSYSLSSDAEGDVVAERLGNYDEADGFDHVAHYLGKGGWLPLPDTGADPGDIFLPGPGNSVLMAGLDHERSELRVRRWTPRTARWTREWSRDFAPGQMRRALVGGVDLAVGEDGQATLAFQEREVGAGVETVRVAIRDSATGWSRARVLERRRVDRRQGVTAPVVGSAGAHAVVAWSTPGRGLEQRVVHLAWLGDERVVVRKIATVGSFRGFRDLSLEVDLRADGDLLLTYLQRRGSRHQLVAWAGRRGHLEPTVLQRDAGVMLVRSAFLVPGLAAVVRYASGGRLVSLVQER